MDRTDRIIPIDELPDFRVAEGDPDVRGWDVLSGDGRTIGEVNNLLVDVDAMKVRYLDVDLDQSVVDADANRHILIPIGYARVDEADDRIFVDSLDASTVPKIPEYRDEVVTRDYESTLRVYFDRSFVGGNAEGGEDDDFYTHDLYSSDRFYETRRNSTGRMREMMNEKKGDLSRIGYQAEPAPAFVDSGSYGADAPVKPAGFGPEITRDGDISHESLSDGPRETSANDSRISAAGGHFGSGWSDDEIVRRPLQRNDDERIRGL